MGSIAEDAIKKHRKSNSQSPPQYGGPGGQYGGPGGQYGAPPSQGGSSNSMMDQLGGFFKK